MQIVLLQNRDGTLRGSAQEVIICKLLFVTHCLALWLHEVDHIEIAHVEVEFGDDL